MISAGRTDIGNVRKRNEDSLLLNDQLGLFIVADGIGGLFDGHIASRTVTLGINNYIESRLSAESNFSDDSYCQILCEAFEQTNKEISMQIASGQARKMGAACLGVLLRNRKIYFAHAGDCRLYVLRAGHLHKINREHTRVREMMEQGILSEDEAKTHKLRHMITKAVGPMGEVAPDTDNFALQQGDKVVLTTDGLLDVCDEHDIQRFFSEAENPEDGCVNLITFAKQGDAKDNLTVVAVFYD
jgi:protein phosphatase